MKNWMHNLFLAVVGLSLLMNACKSSTDLPKEISQKEQFSFLKDNPGMDLALDTMVGDRKNSFVYARVEGLDGTLLYEHSAVNNALYPGLELTGDSWFRVWSMSKIITISTAMDMIEDGLIKLEEPVSKYIPEFGELKVAVSSEGKPVTDYSYKERKQICPIQYVPMETEMTVLHLINHQAGFYYPWTDIECLDNIWKGQDLNSAQNSDELIGLMKDMPLVQQPGHTYYYGLNTTVLGLVLERATGKSLKQLVKERITDPLKIEGLQYSIPDGISLLPRTVEERS